MKYVSIIILCSNNEYIHLCINVLLSQLRDGDEMIVVDDHSTGEILEILNTYHLKSTIKLIHSPKHGNRSFNRNLGASYAQNEILVFVDGDIIISANSIDKIKKFYDTMSDAAAICLLHATRYSMKPFELLTGFNNYLELVSSEEGRKQIYDNPYFKDSREDVLLNAKSNKYFWLYFYSGFCTVRSEMFASVNGFDETFSGWGAEDVDLGYRISLHGTIGFLPHCHGVHIPHARDMLKIEYNNYLNLRNMFYKYNNWEFEVLAHYRAILSIFESFELIIGQMQMLKLSIMEHTKTRNSIYIESISQTYPHGKITYYNDFGNQVIFNAIGMVQPVKSNVEYIFINENIFIYPPDIFNIILQESLNICNTVYICPSHDCIRILWDKKINLFYCPSQYRLKYTSHDIMDYFFEDENGLLKVTSHIPKYLKF